MDYIFNLSVFTQERFIMIKFLCNAFSLNMLSSMNVSVVVKEMSVETVQGYLTDFPECVSAIGHGETALVFSSVLGLLVPMNRATVSLVPGDNIIVGQYSGPRLPEGATTLPDGATIKWVFVSII